MNLSDFQWPFHASRASYAVAELLVFRAKTRRRCISRRHDTQPLFTSFLGIEEQLLEKTIKSEVVAHYLAMWCAAIILAIWLQCVTDFRYTWRGRDGQVVTVDEHHAKGSGSESRRLKHK